MGQRADAIIGFAVAGAAVVFLAQWQPELAVGVVGLIALGVILTHPQELQDLMQAFQTAAHPI